MKKLAVLTMVAFLVGLAAPALAAPGYHEVYKWDLRDGVLGWGLTDEAEMFSKDSDDDQYRWQSAEGVVPGVTLTYAPPTPNPPVQFDIYNYVHLFPWIDIDITETQLIWDIFKPGDYMAKTFMLQFKANCPVLVHLGSGTWQIPDVFVGTYMPQDGHIEPGDFTKEGTVTLPYGDPPYTNDIGMEDKVRLYSLLGATEPEKSPNVSDEEDKIEVRLWWYWKHGDKPSTWQISTDEFGRMPPKGEWPLARNLNSTEIIIPDTNALHEHDNTHLVFFEDLFVEQCDSEGKYFEVFAITITADP